MPMTYSSGQEVWYTGPDAYLADGSLASGASGGTVSGHITSIDTSSSPTHYTISWDLGTTSSTPPPPAISHFAATDPTFTGSITTTRPS